MDGDQRTSLAIVGSGVAGLTAAYLLKDKFNITLIEKNDYIGGHTHTIEIDDDPHGPLAVDTGFIVMNHRNYPLFTELLCQLGISVQDSNMSFGHYDTVSNLYYNTDTLKGLFAQRKNLFSPSFYLLLYQITRFFKLANRDLEKRDSYEYLSKLSLGDYLKLHHFPKQFIDNYLIPMGSAIWSTPTNQMMEFPLLSFLRFYKNHGLLSISDHPQWKTVIGGSHSYVKKILESFKGKVLVKSPVKTIERKSKVKITLENGETHFFDQVLLACHADEAYKLLSDPSADETRLLAPWSYSQNKTILHTDTTLLPPTKDAWASWNFSRGIGATGDEGLTLTYNMNKLQRLNSERNYLVTLNPNREIDPKKIIFETTYNHPRFNFESMATQRELPMLSGENLTFYCGSYFGNGFHEDAVRSAVEVARKLGVFFP